MAIAPIRCPSAEPSPQINNMAVEARASAAQGRVYLRALKADAVSLLRLLELGGCELSLLLCDDEEIRRLNRDFRGKDKATDVLSFEQELESWEIARSASGSRPSRDPLALPPVRRGGGDTLAAYPRLLGDVVISLETAARQAFELGQSPRERLRTLLIHGVLHLIGYDHERSAAEARRMFARERKLAAAMESCGAGPPRGAADLPRTSMPPRRGRKSVKPADAAAGKAGAGAALPRSSRPSHTGDAR